MTHPRNILLGAQAGGVRLPVCDHYSGVPARMEKSLALQRELMEERGGACVVDVTLDCEDGAPVGAERDHAALVADLLSAAHPNARVGVRIHPVDHPSFLDDVETFASSSARLPSFLMIPKVESPACVDRAVEAWSRHSDAPVPLHVLIESPLAIHRVFEIAAHPRVESLSFGLMDFVSAHGGAIPADAMTALGQFAHPLVVRAKLALASAAHAHGKVPSHCVVTEFKDLGVLAQAARRARLELGYTRMWSIHPDQIRVIVDAFAPSLDEVDQAATIIDRAAAAQWAPVSVAGQLHDRASYRYFWQVLERAHQTGRLLPQPVRSFFN